MTHNEAMAALEAAGSAQTRKTFTRHGVDPANAFGVSYAELYKLAKKAGTDKALAESLWATANHDARILATLVAPGSLSVKTLETWTRACDNYVLTDAVSAVAVRMPRARGRMEKWINSKKEYIAAVGWNVLAGLAMAGTPQGTTGRVKKQPAAAPISDKELLQWLDRIERDIHAAPNRTRHAMNNALICIGARGGDLEAAALAAAGRIGKVHVDHGLTSCKTPDAAEYIRKMTARRKPVAT